MLREWRERKREGEGEGEGEEGREKERERKGDEIQYLTSAREDFEHPLANINGSHGCSISNIEPDG